MGTVLQRPFEKMGARLRVHPARAQNASEAGISIDVRRDKDGEYFDLQVTGNPTLTVLEVRPEDRHLVLMSKTPGPFNKHYDINSKFLCGHDERHWFVAAVPETAGVTTVRQAKEALKPSPVRDRELATGIRPKEKQLRKNAARVRQGEWYFLPVDLQPDKRLLLKHEPFNRPSGKPHYAEQAYRAGGTAVWVRGTSILTEAQHAALPAKERMVYIQRRQGARMYVRGRITHPDHKTLILDGWHEVYMNRENEAFAGRSVTFLD